MATQLSPFRTILAVARGYSPRLFQPRGWAIAAFASVSVALAILFQLKAIIDGQGLSPTGALDVFHFILVTLMLPIMSLVAAPAGVREDLEHRTLPMVLTRPTTVWAVPLGKGLLWFFWGSLWLVLACLGLLILGVDLETAMYMALALTTAFWFQLAFLTLFGLLFKWGTFWSAVYLIAWNFGPLVRVMPGNLQRSTVRHYIESIVGSRADNVNTVQFLAQQQIVTPVWISVAVLVLAGLLCWALAGWKLQVTPIGLAGADAEG